MSRKERSSNYSISVLDKRKKHTEYIEKSREQKEISIKNRDEEKKKLLEAQQAEIQIKTEHMKDVNDSAIRKAKNRAQIKENLKAAEIT